MRCHGEKAGNILKLLGILVCFLLLLALMFFDFIDLMIPGSFPDWVYVAELIALGVIGVLEILNFTKEFRKK